MGGARGVYPGWRWRLAWVIWNCGRAGSRNLMCNRSSWSPDGFRLHLMLVVRCRIGVLMAHCCADSGLCRRPGWPQSLFGVWHWCVIWGCSRCLPEPFSAPFARISGLQGRPRGWCSRSKRRALVETARAGQWCALVAAVCLRGGSPLIKIQSRLVARLLRGVHTSSRAPAPSVQRQPPLLRQPSPCMLASCHSHPNTTPSPRPTNTRLSPLAVLPRLFASRSLSLDARPSSTA